MFYIIFITYILYIYIHTKCILYLFYINYIKYINCIFSIRYILTDLHSGFPVKQCVYLSCGPDGEPLMDGS